MMLKWRDSWGKEPPVDIEFCKDGSVDFKGAIGSVHFPEDYMAFMKMTDGLTISDEERYFLARYKDGLKICRYEYGWDFSDVVDLSDYYYDSMFHDENDLPNGFIGIAQGDDEEDNIHVLMCVEKASADYGKIFAWARSHDPWMTGGNTAGLGFVADSFTDFMNNLTTRESL